MEKNKHVPTTCHWLKVLQLKNEVIREDLVSIRITGFYSEAKALAAMKQSFEKIIKINYVTEISETAFRVAQKLNSRPK